MAANAAAARVRLDDDDVARVARAAAPVSEKFAAAMLPLAMEVEPATFVSVQRQERAK
ncbi:MAG: hypothetical protein J0H62_11500 [Rhizobiales bacterium]|nr:hypothetical protein [Hyphomicrobiales bacterium]